MSPTPTFDFGEKVFLQTLCKRQDAFLNRYTGKPQPWSDDSLIANYRFTNVYRVLDRNSQYLIRHVILSGSDDTVEQFYRILLFRLFNRITTWEHLSSGNELKWANHEHEYLIHKLDEIIDAKEPLFTSSYSSPQTGALHIYPGDNTAHRMIGLTERILSPYILDQIFDARSLQDIVTALKIAPGIGDFLGNQIALDFTYTKWGKQFASDDWTVPGPGAIAGLKLVYISKGGNSTLDAIRYLHASIPEGLEKYGLTFNKLETWPFSVSDTEHWLCETWKYIRLAATYLAGGGSAKGGRSTRQFEPVGELEMPILPW